MILMLIAMSLFRKSVYEESLRSFKTGILFILRISMFQKLMYQCVWPLS